MSENELEDFYAGVYAPGRGDSIDACIGRTLHTFQLLRDVDPSFQQWFTTGSTRAEALEHRLDLTRSDLAAGFEPDTTGENRWYYLGAWNGLDDESSSTFRLICGSPTAQDTDSLIFEPARGGEMGARLIQQPLMARLLRTLVVAWDPQFGIVMSRQHRESTFAHAEFEHRIGWINYFSHKLGPIPPLPSPVQTEPVEGKGSMVILTPERWASSNPEHVALSLRVSAELKSAGVLRPLLQPPPRLP